MTDVENRLRTTLADRYRIERELGRGGMATVSSPATCGTKVLSPDLAASLGAERFLQEIRMTAGLQHPHILPLDDSGEANGLLRSPAPSG